MREYFGPDDDYFDRDDEDDNAVTGDLDIPDGDWVPDPDIIRW